MPRGGHDLHGSAPLSNEEENANALKQMETVVNADTTPAAELDLKAISS